MMAIRAYKPTDLYDTALDVVEFENLTRRRFIIGAGGLLGAAALAACGAPGANAPTAVPTGPARTIAGVLGNSYTLSAPPQRLHASGGTDMDNALALGVVPASIELYGDSQLRADQRAAATATAIRFTEGPNFEQLAAARPDFILTGWGDELYQRRMAEIAPTVFIDSTKPWREIVRQVAQPLFRDAEAEQVIRNLEQRFADFKARFANRQGQTPCLLYLAAEGTISLLTRESSVGGLLTELGFAPIAKTGDLYGENIALESLPTEATGDFLIVLVDTWRISDPNEAIPASVQSFLDTPVVKQLPAAAGGTFVFPADGNVVYYLSALSIPIFVDQLASLLA
ncbi:MAG: ABC transporter substrate-binding protein [Chloroflexaceae bacterium]|jgi:ABC-type Fe3+-hydroxamate transport system substrate-binding protein|nr:ABC transporter substrate-binding protein [Chloroflexaceae bacterium]